MPRWPTIAVSTRTYSGSTAGSAPRAGSAIATMRRSCWSANSGTRSTVSGPVTATIRRSRAGKAGRREVPSRQEMPMTAGHGTSEVPPPPTWLSSDRFLARRVGQPLAAFLHVEAAGGILLVLATVAALVWANVWPDGYETFWSTEIAHRQVGDFSSFEPLERLGQRPADGGVLLRRRHGDQARARGRASCATGAPPRCRPSPRSAAWSCPALDLPRVQRRRCRAPTGGASRWRPTSPSPSASSPCSVAGAGAARRCSCSRLAIVDDIGAIVVIAVFYTEHIDPGAGSLLAAVAAVAIVVAAPGAACATHRSTSPSGRAVAGGATSPASTPRSPAW